MGLDYEGKAIQWVPGQERGRHPAQLRKEGLEAAPGAFVVEETNPWTSRSMSIYGTSPSHSQLWNVS